MQGDWRGIAQQFVTTRTPTQVASHAQKHFIRRINNQSHKRRSSLFDLDSDSLEQVSPVHPPVKNALESRARLLLGEHMPDCSHIKVCQLSIRSTLQAPSQRHCPTGAADHSSDTQQALWRGCDLSSSYLESFPRSQYPAVPGAHCTVGCTWAECLCRGVATAPSLCQEKYSASTVAGIAQVELQLSSS